MNATQHVLKCMVFVVVVVVVFLTVFAVVVVFTVFARKQRQQTIDSGFFVMVFAGGMGVIVKQGE